MAGGIQLADKLEEGGGSEDGYTGQSTYGMAGGVWYEVTCDKSYLVHMGEGNLGKG